ncbi:TylF/MycF family methyltransferase [Methylophilus glucosoxydans]|uniref:TylF/MycF family methyltransferase n=1 Tax=Methylophilus glucosoxydans TaxID=752553 RepID=A0ABW3GIV3_9PROT
MRKELDAGGLLYVDLLKKALTNWIHGHEEFIKVDLAPRKAYFAKWILPENTFLVKPQKFDEKKRESGLDWPGMAHTMIGLKRLSNIQFCIEQVIKNDVPGDFIETGVWRGGGVIFMRGMLKALSVTDRLVWAADSFEGLPKPDPEKYPADLDDPHYKIDYLRVSLEAVKENFSAYGLLDNQVKFLKGWFKDTLPQAPIDKLAILRLDGDMYESTMDALKSLYPKLSTGGYVIVDDYSIVNCAKAIHDFRGLHKINDEIIDIDGVSAFWKKT